MARLGLIQNRASAADDLLGSGTERSIAGTQHQRIANLERFIGRNGPRTIASVIAVRAIAVILSVIEPYGKMS